MSTTSSRQYNFVDDRNSGIPITASRVDGELDNIISKLNEKVIIKATAPTSPIEGMIWYNTTLDQLNQYRNAEWVVMGAVHFGIAAMATPQAGDTWYDTSGSELVVKVRNKANDAWLTIAQSNDGVPIGTILFTGNATPDTGYLFCYGQAVSRTTYALLFAKWGTTYGVGDGSTTFNLIDMRGRSPLGKDDMGGSSANVVTDAQADSLGGALGAETVNLQHNHGGVTGTPSGTVLCDDNSGGTDQNPGSATHTHTIANAGSTTQSIMDPKRTGNFQVRAL